MRAFLPITPALALAAAALPARAADNVQVSELVVTATRLPAPQREAPDATVVTRDDIELRQATVAADVLALVPGVSLSQNGGFGGVTGVSLRGMPIDKTLVLIDGVVQNDASQPNGGYDFAGLDLADVERIEVLSGPQGSLWGSDAIGGVVSITTREEDGWRASLEGGSYGTLRGSLAAGASTDAWAAQLSASGYRADGVSKADGFPEPDGERSWTVAGGARARLTDRVTLEGRLRYADTWSQVDGYAAPTFAFGDTAEIATSKAWTGYVRAIVDGPLGFRQTLQLGGYDLDRSSYGGDSPYRYRATRQDWRWTASRGAPEDRWGLDVGAEYQRDRATLSTGEGADLDDTSLFVVGRLRPIQRLSVTASVRYDDPTGYAGRATGRASAALDLGRGFTLAGDWGQGFKTPTISQTACDFCFPAGPSVGLKPELAEGWDLGLAWRSQGGRLQARVTGYRLAVKNQISYGVGRYVNIDRTLSHGVDADARVELTSWLAVRGTYAWTEAVDRSTDLPLLRVPAHAGTLGLEWRRDRLSGALTLRAEGAQADANPSTFLRDRRPGFAVVDLAAGYRLTPRIELTARIDNLTDRHWQQALGYGEPRLAGFLGVRVKE
ncbi:MAG TPA: TonB-dependent receptor [Caulobacteraceae bacterium]|nr:TonB-dependent receptor [Caulobacteraceae bacterium]